MNPIDIWLLVYPGFVLLQRPGMGVQRAASQSGLGSEYNLRLNRMNGLNK